MQIDAKIFFSGTRLSNFDAFPIWVGSYAEAFDAWPLLRRIAADFPRHGSLVWVERKDDGSWNQVDQRPVGSV